MDEELFDLLLAYLPDSFEGWIGLAIVFCAVLASFWPKPSEKAHPFWRGLHSLVNAIAFNIRHAKNIQTRYRAAQTPEGVRKKPGKARQDLSGKR